MVLERRHGRDAGRGVEHHQPAAVAGGVRVRGGHGRRLAPAAGIIPRGDTFALIPVLRTDDLPRVRRVGKTGAPTLVTADGRSFAKSCSRSGSLSISAVLSTLVYLVVSVACSSCSRRSSSPGACRGAGVPAGDGAALPAESGQVELLLSSLGVFLTDIRNIVSVAAGAAHVLLGGFLSVERIPADFRFLVEYNPLTILVESGRRTLLVADARLAGGGVTVLSLLAAGSGFAFFSRARAWP